MRTDFFEKKRHRVGSSEIFSLVQHYLNDQELLNFGVQPTSVRSEQPFVTAFYLYHKVRETLPTPMQLNRSMGDFGLAAEFVAEKWLKDKGYNPTRPEQCINGNCVASADFICTATKTINQDGVIIAPGDKFICENKTFVPQMLKKVKVEGIPFKYICQLQYQLWLYKMRVGAFSSLELTDDTADERSYIAGVFSGSKSNGLKRFYARFQKSIVFMEYKPEYGAMFELVLQRFFDDVNNAHEPELCFEDDPALLFSLLRINSAVRDALPAKIPEGLIQTYQTKKNAYNEVKFEYDLYKKKIVDILYRNQTLTGKDDKNTIIVQGNNSLKII